MTSSKPDRLVAWWLVLMCAMVIAMIAVGGLTRLTDSGLSITEWRLDKGLTPPLTAERWAEEFALYRQTTEYQQQNRGMSLGEFQTIYWWEWGHRFLGKLLGGAFLIPFLIFWRMGKLEGRALPVFLFGALIGVQGAIGWWMVVSGLEGRLDVSPLRLAVHLGMAFLILALGARLAIEAFGWPREAGEAGAPRALVNVFVACLFAQILFGALMSGADAGARFDDWPTIGGEWLPSAYGPFDLENRATLQFHHRSMGYLVAVLALWLGFRAWRRGLGAARKIGLLVGVLALAQAGLGIAAILTGSHLSLSLIHQMGAVALWLAAIALWRATEMR